MLLKKQEFQEQKILIQEIILVLVIFNLTSRNKLLKLRCSAAKGYLNPVKKRSNLKIVTKAHVQKINFEGKKAKGV
jgi:hypothetical protein